ncbi:hypothetical protein [Methanobacterium sp. ACI-7]|uniref:hypothetical protein n=1 Tax=unclassified Methanobacterium TaxID=2627676 RepID=UPI0039C2DC20
MNNLTKYDDIKFAIRCVDVWKNLKPSDHELNDVMDYEKNKSEESKSIVCQPLQDYLEMLIALVHEETGEWFFYVDISGILYDFISSGDLSLYQTKSGYSVCFKK